MKRAILLFFALLLLFPVMAKTDRATLNIMESFAFEGMNFTVINLSPTTDTVLFCINNKKAIFVQDKVKKYNGIYVEVLDVRRNDVRFKVEIDDGKECGEECRNVKCFLECKADLDCDDGNEETADKCVAGKCRNNIIEEVMEEDALDESIGEIGESLTENVGAVTIMLISVVILLVLIFFLRKR